MADSEVSVLTRVLDAISELDDAGARRIVGWLIDKYGLPRDIAGQRPAPGPVTSNGIQASGIPVSGDFASFYADAAPASDKERALVAGYWLQVIQREGDLDGLAINRELNNLGHRVGNITKALSHLMNQDPQLVIQTRKSGGSQQARKKYRLTRAGIDVVESMVNRTQAK